MLIPIIHAQCPVCIVTVGGGLFIAKKLGVDVRGLGGNFHGVAGFAG